MENELKVDENEFEVGEIDIVFIENEQEVGGNELEVDEVDIDFKENESKVSENLCAGASVESAQLTV